MAAKTNHEGADVDWLLLRLRLRSKSPPDLAVLFRVDVDTYGGSLSVLVLRVVHVLHIRSLHIVVYTQFVLRS